MTTGGSDGRPGGHGRDPYPSSQGENGERSTEGFDLTDLSRSMLSRLSQTIETEIVPRFMLALDTHTDAPPPSAIPDLSAEIDEFVDLVLYQDASVATRYVSTLRAGGAPLADIYLNVLAPAARKLGVMWEDDDATFTDVSIGLCRMHQVLLEFSRCFDPAEGTAAAGRNALVVPTPGEEHTFGLFIVVEFLRRAGWHCWTGSPSSVTDVRSLVREHEFDAVLVSLSADRHIDTARDTIADLRKYSRNKESAVLLGGRAVMEQPELVAQLGADETAKDGRDAVRILNNMYGVANGASAQD